MVKGCSNLQCLTVYHNIGGGSGSVQLLETLQALPALTEFSLHELSGVPRWLYDGGVSDKDDSFFQKVLTLIL
jgi:hypothetical protein